jgi:LacI family transcriptional regulator
MPTMKDVAEYAGVSTATVSHVLNGTRIVQSETSERVRTAVKHLQYEMNGTARSLRVRTTSTIALIIPDLSNPFFPEVAVVIQQEAARAGYDVVIYSIDVPHGDSADLFDHYLRAIRRKRYDAVIYAETVLVTPTAHQQLIDSGTPIILIGGTPHPEADRVYIDNYAAARDVVAYLVGKGHRDIAHITGAPGMASASTRQQGYRDGLLAAGITPNPDLEVAGTFLSEGGYLAMQQLLTRTPRPSAVFAANDETALGAMCACVDAHVSVPDEVAIVGFDDIALAANVRPALTTVYHGQREIGREAIRLAVNAHTQRTPEGGEEQKQTVIVPHRLIVRDSG